MGTKKAVYPFESKVAAVRAVVDEGMTKPEAMAKFGIASPSLFARSVSLPGGWPEALRPKPGAAEGREGT